MLISKKRINVLYSAILILLAGYLFFFVKFETETVIFSCIKLQHWLSIFCITACAMEIFRCIYFTKTGIYTSKSVIKIKYSDMFIIELTDKVLVYSDKRGKKYKEHILKPITKSMQNKFLIVAKSETFGGNANTKVAE
jgi:hypothetical protein